MEAEMEKRHAAELEAVDGPKVVETFEDLSLYGKAEAAEARGGAKPSKAQRQREKRAKEEAEREARIKEELANIGDTQQKIEARQLFELLAPLGLRVHDIPADGHCLYRSLSHQLHLADGAATSYQELRRAAAEYMRAHPDDFLPFADLSPYEDEEGDFVGGREGAWSSYLADVADSATWGGQLELQAISRQLRRRIRVVTVGMPLLTLGEDIAEGDQAGGDLTVCYLKHAYGLGEHYNSVVPFSAAAGGSGGSDAGGEAPAAGMRVTDFSSDDDGE